LPVGARLEHVLISNPRSCGRDWEIFTQYSDTLLARHQYVQTAGRLVNPFTSQYFLIHTDLIGLGAFFVKGNPLVYAMVRPIVGNRIVLG